jgi:hypothetical protein
MGVSVCGTIYNMTQGVLYISYDGMLEPLGQSQVLAYLKRIAHGRRIHLLPTLVSFAPWRSPAYA